ncbi:MAG: DUF2834 domain-containing protein [Alkalispirochaetaceae bacterium]
MRYLYLLLAILGAVLPLSQFVPASIDGSFSVGQLISELMATRNLRGVAFDLLVAAVTGVVFMVVEGRRKRVAHLWLPLIGTVFVGFSFGLPIFLFLRETREERLEPSDGTS